MNLEEYEAMEMLKLESLAKGLNLLFDVKEEREKNDDENKEND